jgi:EmrB/QacA subfamily drug resistance transporter
MQVSAQAEGRTGGLPYKWVVAIVVIFGLFMSVLDSTIVNIAIPRLQNAFGANLNSVQWVITGYTLAQGVATPLTPFIASRLGLKRFYIFSLIAFTIGSALCGLSFNLPMLIFFRVLQGAGGAFLFPLTITLLYREFPPAERGAATGALGVPILLAPALGPTLGGYIVTFSDWPLIFYINVPIGIIAVILSIVLLREFRLETRTRFDVAGFLLSASGLALVLFALSDASTDGWGSIKVLACLVIGLVLLVALIFVELSIIRNEGTPLLDLRVFTNAPFTAANLATILVVFALFGGLFLFPIYLQSLRGLSAFQAGLLLLPQAFASMVGSLIGGRLVDRLGVRAIVIPGLIILTITTWLLFSLSLQTPYSTIQFYLVLRGLALGLSFQPLTVAALAEISPRQLSQASSINTVVRFIGQSLSIAIIATYVQSQTKIHFKNLADLVVATSPAGQLIARLQALFLSRGADPTQALSAALQVVAGQLQLQSYMLAIKDAFGLTFVLSILAIVAVCFVRSRRQSQVVAESGSANEGEEEGMPVGAFVGE